MKKKPEQPIKSVSIRIPVDLLEELHRVAHQHNRSLNGEILTVLQAHVKIGEKRREKSV